MGTAESDYFEREAGTDTGVSEELRNAIAAVVGYTYGTNVVKSPGELTDMLCNAVTPVVARLKAEGLRCYTDKGKDLPLFWPDKQGPGYAYPNPDRLRPCPFCGPGESIVEVVENQFGQWQVACGRCGTHSGIRPDKDRAKTIEHWNIRRP